MSDTERELSEYRDQAVDTRRLLARRRVDRRLVLKGSTVLALAGTGGAAAFLEACSSGSKNAGTPTAESNAAAGSATAGGSASTWKDTTSTPEYKQGLSFEQANIDPKWQAEPYTYKYNWRRYNWNTPLTKGGHCVTGIATGGIPAGYFNLMTSAENPFLAINYQGLYHPGIHEGLDLDGYSLETDMATGATHNADYTQWTFKIPPDVKFQDIAPVNGRLCTADDVVFSFQRYIDTSIWASALSNVSKITAPDPTTVVFDMKQPQVTFDGIVGTPYYLIFAKEHYENADLFKSTAIGTGPWQVESNTYQAKKENVRFTGFNLKSSWMKGANANQQLPFMDRLTEQYYPSDAALVASFIAGSSDDYLIDSFSPDKLSTILSSNPNMYIQVNPGWATYPLGIMWSYKSKPFQDVRVRRALSMAIDRKAIMKQIFNSGTIGGGPVQFDLLGLKLPRDLSEYGQYYQFNPQAAQQLMKEAGFENGTSFTFEIASTYPASLDGIRWDAIQLVQQYWQQNLKVDLKIVQKDGLAANNDYLNHSYGDMTLLPPVVGGDAYSLMVPILHTSGGANYGAYSDKTMDGLLDQLGAAPSPDKVLALTKQVQQKVQDECTWLYIGWPQAAWLSQPWIHGELENLYTCMCYYGMGDRRNVWIDQTAPGGRGGKPV